MTDFDPSDWETRLSDALRALAKTQISFMEDYWNANGFPTQYSFNGKDETPFPTYDYYRVYEAALTAKTSKDKEHYTPLAEALAPLRSLLRVHPAFATVLKMKLGPEAVQVGIINGQSYTSIAQFISGFMARQYYRPNKKFLWTAQEINSLLSLASRHNTSPLSNDLDLGYDIDLYYGAKIDKKYDQGGGLLVLPFSELREYIELIGLRTERPIKSKHVIWICFLALLRLFVGSQKFVPFMVTNRKNAHETCRHCSIVLQQNLANFCQSSWSVR